MVAPAVAESAAMGSKFLQVVGVLAILGLVGGSIAALGIVKQRLHVTFAAEDEAAQRGPDPVELLRADLGTVATDVAALNRNLESGLQELHGALETSAGEREQRLAVRVAALEGKLAALESAAATSNAALIQAINAQATALLERTASDAGAAAKPMELTVADVAPVIEAPPPPVEVAPTPPALPPAPKKSFLSFQLPSAAFTFDRRQRFVLVPSLSRVGFDAKSTLHDFSGVTSKIDGTFTVNLAKAAEKPLGKITVEAAALETGLADRDVSMRKTLAVEQFKTMTFEWTGFAPSAVDPSEMTLAGEASGKLTLHGVTREVTLPVKVSVDASKRVAIDGELMVKLSDYKVEPPTQVGVIKVDDELKLWIALRARLEGAALDDE